MEKVLIRYFYIINIFIGGIVMSILNNLCYFEEYEWVKIEGNEVVIGIIYFV